MPYGLWLPVRALSCAYPPARLLADTCPLLCSPCPTYDHYTHTNIDPLTHHSCPAENGTAGAFVVRAPPPKLTSPKPRMPWADGIRSSLPFFV